MPVQIPRTTLCCIDCSTHELAARALAISLAHCRFEQALFLTDRPMRVDGVTVRRIPTIASGVDYSVFVLSQLVQHISTEFVLLIQWDGYVLSGAAWRPEFQAYDYVGAGFASMTLFPLGAALAPWLGALAIAQASTQIFALYNLKEAATKTGAGGYPCSCGKCVESIGYIINKKENNVAIAAVSIFTVGLALAADRINSIRKSFQKNRPKEQMCRNLINGARSGCICAIGAIILLCGDWPEKVEKQQALILETTAIIWSDDKESGGLVRLKTKW